MGTRIQVYSVVFTPISVRARPSRQIREKQIQTEMLSEVQLLVPVKYIPGVKESISFKKYTEPKGRHTQ